MRRLAFSDLNDSEDPPSSCLTLQTHSQLKKEDAGRLCIFVPQCVGILKADPSPGPAFSLSKLHRSCRKVYVVVIAGHTRNPGCRNKSVHLLEEAARTFGRNTIISLRILLFVRRRRSDMAPVGVVHLEFCS